MFNCVRIGDVFYLAEDMSHQCYVGEHAKIYKLAIFWTIFYVVGIPVFYLCLLFYYSLPQVAAELTQSSELRALVDMAQRKGIPHASAELHALTVANISDELVDALYLGFFVLPGSKKEEELTLSGKIIVIDEHLGKFGVAVSAVLFMLLKPLKLLERLVSAREEDAVALTREAKLRKLQSYARAHLVMDVVTWHRAAKDRRLAGAKQSIGAIYRVRPLAQAQSPPLLIPPFCACRSSTRTSGGGFWWSCSTS